MNYLFHKDGTQPTGNEVFVFGSNLAGRHGKGAAKAAAERFGAKYGVGEGLTGRSYAIPTKDANLKILPLSDIQRSVEKFIRLVSANPDTGFFVTRIGCILAGYKDAQIAAMFKNAPQNCNFPEEWREFL